MEDLKILVREGKNAEIKEKLKDMNIYTLLDIHGENLLHWAGVYNNAEICEYLIEEKKLHVNLQNFRSTTPLYYAASKNSKEAIKVMLKYNANPRIRSGFSGKFPSEITTDSEIRILLYEAENKIPIDYENNVLKVKEGRSLYQSYKYRLYMLNLMNLNYLNNNLPQEVKQRFYGNFEVLENLKILYTEKGIQGVADHVQWLYDDYLNFKDEEKVCLYCNAIADKRCSKCKKVYFCNTECQKKCYLLHKFDC